MNATGGRGVWANVARGIVASIAAVLGVGALSLPAFGLTIQIGGVANSGNANASTGGNTAVGNQSTNNATTSNPVGLAGGLVQPIISVGAPQNNSTGTAAVTTGPAAATGNSASGSVNQARGAGSGPALQSGNVTNSGSAVATTGGNTAIGNQSTNTASVDETVNASLIGLSLNIGGPSNQSSGSATINTGAATAQGNTSDGSVVQAGDGVGRCGRGAALQDANVTNTGTASADTGGNQATGNASTNTATVTQNVNGGLIGLGLNVGGPTNNSTGSAVIDTGPATAVGNQSTGSVVQGSCVSPRASFESLFFRNAPTALRVGQPFGQAGPGLARTGANPLSLGFVAALLLALGLVVVRIAPLRPSE